MRKKPPLRTPKHLSHRMTYAELERWFEIEFEKIARKKLRGERARAERRQNITRVQESNS